jgi:hypothetical protein
MPGNSEVFLSSVTCTGATTTRLEESRNVGELAGEVGDVAVLGDAGQVRGGLAAQRTGAGLARPTAFPLDPGVHRLRGLTARHRTGHVSS